MFRIVSDLHLEFQAKYFAKFIYSSETPDNDLINFYFKKIVTPEPQLNIILAGDIGYPSDEIYVQFIKWVSGYFKRVFLITGNHEYYSYYRKKPVTMGQITERINNIIEPYENVTFLDRHVSPVVIENNWVIMGVTLWSYIPDSNKREIHESMNDYKKIWRNESTLITPDYVNNYLHQPDLDYLKYWIPHYLHYNLLVVTHYLPSFSLIPVEYKNSRLNHAYANNLDEYLEEWDSPTSTLKYWVAGHSHGVNQVSIGSWKLYLNSKGCPSERTGYNSSETLP